MAFGGFGDNFDNFGGNLIAAIEAGRESKRRKMRDAWEEEDRLVEKELLQHRLRELKLNESLQKRNLAIQQLGLMRDVSEQDIPEAQREGFAGGDSPDGPYNPAAYAEGGIGTVPETIQQRWRYKPQTIPGVPEMGVPDFQVRPQTYEQSMERELGSIMAKKRMEAMWEPYTLGPDATRWQGGQIIARGAPRTVAPRAQAPERPVPVVTRALDGTETIIYMTPTEAAEKGPFTRAPIPRVGGAGGRSLGVGGDINIDDFVDGLIDGTIPTSKTPSGALGTRIIGAAKKKGFDFARADRDGQALKAFYGTMNNNDFTKLRMTVDETDRALANLATSVEAWGSSGLPLLSSAALSLARRGVYDDVQIANDIESSINMITTNLAKLSSGGDTATNKALETAQKTLQGNWSKDRLLATIKSLQNNLRIRRGSIEGLNPLLPGAGAGAGGTVVAPTTTPNGGPAPGTIKDGAAPGVPQNGAVTPAQVKAWLEAIGKDSSQKYVDMVIKNPAMLRDLISRQPK